MCVAACLRNCSTDEVVYNPIVWQTDHQHVNAHILRFRNWHDCKSTILLINFWPHLIVSTGLSTNNWNKLVRQVVLFSIYSLGLCNGSGILLLCLSFVFLSLSTSSSHMRSWLSAIPTVHLNLAFSKCWNNNNQSDSLDAVLGMARQFRHRLRRAIVLMIWCCYETGKPREKQLDCLLLNRKSISICLRNAFTISTMCQVENKPIE